MTGASHATLAMHFVKTSCGITLMALAACGGPDRGAPLNPDLPGIVVEQLPLGVSLDSVFRDPNGCFFYSENGTVFVVDDDFGVPICRP